MMMLSREAKVLTWLAPGIPLEFLGEVVEKRPQVHPPQLGAAFPVNQLVVPLHI